MKFLVTGQGGREHAIVRALRLSPSVKEIHCIPGSDGISHDALCHPWDERDHEAVCSLVKKIGIDVVVLGPDAHLAIGVADSLRKSGAFVVGPSKNASQLESSKLFAKEFMTRAKIPTAKFQEVKDIPSTLAAAKNFTAPFVFKADGLAAGKGVFICDNIDELNAAAVRVFEKKEFGDSGKRAFLEEFFPGWELSYLVLTNGREYQSLPLAQDHKRIFEGDRGPNTGGMGTVAPLKIASSLQTQIAEQVLDPIMHQMQKENFDYRGILFIGMMITKNGPSVLEFNVRFGDPETQVIMPLLDGDWGKVFSDLSRGILTPLKWKPMSAACVVLAAEGYPDSPKKDITILGDVFAESPSAYFLHAGTKKANDGKWKTSGGRVINAIGIGANVKEAIEKAYQQSERVRWNGVQFRTDIGKMLL
ncbi:MAG: hypothetical protein A4S09_00295 [Proteobacteria bacterium SG_bin7]|nr:MAG: hypothetical protein A4S09_00295 [Proteobacteria bacterium SG_bin7]